jgi:hypothetical protein
MPGEPKYVAAPLVDVSQDGFETEPAVLQSFAYEASVLASAV